MTGVADLDVPERARLTGIGFVGVKEAAELLGVTGPRLYQINMPEPVVRLACGPIWLRSEIIEFGRTRPRRKT